MNRYGSIIMLLTCCLLAGCQQPSNPAAEETALKIAQAWLELVDQGKYDQSWEETADYFKAAVNKEQWRQQMEAFRKPLGDVQLRHNLSRQYRTTLPGAPDGEYVILQFKTSFSQKQSAIETITPMKIANEQWRVSGYFIK